MPASLCSTDKSLAFPTSTGESSSVDSQSSLEEVGNGISHYRQQFLDIILENVEGFGREAPCYNHTNATYWFKEADWEDFEAVQAMTDQIMKKAGRRGSKALWKAVESMVDESVHHAPSDMQHLLKLAYVVMNMLPSSPEKLPALLKLYTGFGTFPVNRVCDILRVLKVCARDILHGLKSLVSMYDPSSTPQGGGIHKVTAYLMTYIKWLQDHGSLVDSILARDDEGNPSHELRKDSLNFFVEDLIFCLYHVLERSSKLYESEGLRWIFLLNNTHLILRKLKDSGYDWILKYQNQFEQLLAAYLESSWGPVLSCLEIKMGMLCLWFSRPPVARFNAKLEVAYVAQKNWRIEDPELRHVVRKAVSARVLEGYQAYLQSCVNCEKYQRYTPQDLDVKLMELFEG